MFAVPDLDITAHLAACLAKDGICSPTDVQQAAAAPILMRRAILLQSGTGTGKTLAYLLPLLQRARLEKEFRCVVIAPSPELAVQILRVAEAYKAPGVGTLGVVGGGNVERQKDKLKKHPQVMVGTPGRVSELIFMRKIKTAQIDTLVLDEADAILSAKNAAELGEICSRPEFAAQIICASATFGDATVAFMNTYAKSDVTRVTIDSQRALSPTIAHHVVTLEDKHYPKDAVLVDLIDHLKLARALIFVNKLYAVTHLHNLLNQAGIACIGLSSERSKYDRQRAIAALRSGEVQVIVATDTLARGLDIKDLDWVIHYEAAINTETYLHRAGRVGRAGRPGRSVVLAAKRDIYDLQRFAKALGIEFVDGVDAP